MQSEKDFFATHPAYTHLCAYMYTYIHTYMQSEKDFFATHPAYTHLAARQGTMYLSKKLNLILEDHIRACMPEISQRVKVMLRDAQIELKQYGDDDTRKIVCVYVCMYVLSMLRDAQIELKQYGDDDTRKICVCVCMYVCM